MKLLSLLLVPVAAACGGARDDVRMHDSYLAGASAQRGLAAIARYGCGACHTAPGLPGARGRVAPSFADFRERTYVAGVVPNTPANVVRWIMNPKAVDSLTAMPNLAVAEADARDIAFYLYSLK